MAILPARGVSMCFLLRQRDNVAFASRALIDKTKSIPGPVSYGIMTPSQEKLTKEKTLGGEFSWDRARAHSNRSIAAASALAAAAANGPAIETLLTS